MPTQASSVGRPRPRVVVVGAGVAGLEACLALRQFAGDRAHVTLIAPNRYFTYRPIGVRDPLAVRGREREPVARIAQAAGAELRPDRLVAIDPQARRVRTAEGYELPYDALVLCVGARTSAVPARAEPFDEDHTAGCRVLMHRVREGHVRSLVFVEPPAPARAFDLYDLAIETAATLRRNQTVAELTVVTSEPAPLAIIGPTATGLLRGTLGGHGVRVVESAYVRSIGLARRYDVTLVQGELAGVDVSARRAHLTSGDVRGYDHLLVAVGARPQPALEGSLTFRGPMDVPMVEWVVAEVKRGHRRHVLVVVPSTTTWPLPAYELAIMAANELRGVADATVTLATPEREPLWIFGHAACAALRDVLAERGITLLTDTRVAHVTDDVVWLEPDHALIADTVISLARLLGPRIAGLPSDHDGFLPTDAHGYVMGAEHVLAAGDATTFPVKQGGLATQQADAAAATIAHELGAPVTPRPFAPVLRGLLLTGGAPFYLRAELDTKGRRARAAQSRRLAGEVSSRALWWPPGKVAGRYLAPYLSTARPVSLGVEPLVDRTPRGSTGGCGRARGGARLALLLADKDAAAGDLAQALHALDAAAALAGGVLPAEYAERRERWRAELAPARS